MLPTSWLALPPLPNLQAPAAMGSVPTRPMGVHSQHLSLKHCLYPPAPTQISISSCLFQFQTGISDFLLDRQPPFGSQAGISSIYPQASSFSLIPSITQVKSLE